MTKSAPSRFGRVILVQSVQGFAPLKKATVAWPEIVGSFRKRLFDSGLLREECAVTMENYGGNRD